MTHEMQARRSIVSALGAAVAAFTLGPRPAGAQTPATRFQPARHQQDAWLDTITGKHRVFIDASTARGAGEAMLYANNLYVANKSGYSLPENDIVVVACLRHFATPFAFNDAIWAKYGKVLGMMVEFTDPKTRQAPSTNLLNSAEYSMALPNLGTTIDSVVRRGNALRGVRHGDPLFRGWDRGAGWREWGCRLQGARREHDPQQPHGRGRGRRGESRAGVRLHAVEHALNLPANSWPSRRARTAS